MDHVVLSGDSLKAVVKRNGAELVSVKNSAGTEFIWLAEKDIWPRHAPVLFPIVGRLKNDQYRHEGKLWSLPQHGFARDREFELESVSDTMCVFVLKSDEASRKVFPFEFVLRLKYEVSGNTLNCGYVVTNPGKDELLFSIGAHPGFNCPLLPGETYSDYYLDFGNATLLQTILNGGLRSDVRKLTVLDETKLWLSEKLFDDDALVFENGQVRQVTLFHKSGIARVEMTCEGWPYFGVWAKKGSSRFVCLEPWHGIADSEKASGELSEKEGIIRLAPGGIFSCGYSVKFG